MVRALLAGLFIAFSFGSCLAQESTDFDFSVVGELVERLEPGTVVTVSTLGTSEKSPHVFVSSAIEDLPMKLPAADFKGRYTRIFFRSPTLKQNVFSMEMEGNLLDEPRPIKLLLNKPTTSLRTPMTWNTVRFKARVSRRMGYLDLPYWDGELEKLVPMPSPPNLKYTIGNQAERTVEMRGFCMDFKWFANIPYGIVPDSDAKIRYSVMYDSGGAFDPIETKFEYDFRVDRH